MMNFFRQIVASNLVAPKLTLGIVAVLLQSTLAVGQLAVVGTSPNVGNNLVNTNAPIQVVFSRDVQVSTLSVVNFRVYGKNSGVYSGNITYNNATKTAQFTADVPFQSGELVSVVLGSGISAADGSGLINGFQFSFYIAVEFGSGIFDQRFEISIGGDPNNPVERDPEAIFAADFNNDRFIDLAVVNNTTNSVSILTNQFATVTGSFVVGSTVSVGSGPSAISGGDYDRDGLVDLAITNFDDNTVSLLRNVGGSFILVQTIQTAERPTFIEFRDYNNDTFLDIAVTALGVNRLQVFMSDGNSYNTAPVVLTTGASPQAFVSGDFDGDGQLDFAVTNSGDNSISVYLNDGSGQFNNAAEVSVPDFPTAIVAGDFVGTANGGYGDGVLDLAALHPNINAISILGNRSRDGGFVLTQQIDAGLRPSGLFVADLDTTDLTALSTGLPKDYDLDFAVANLFSNDVFIFRNQFNNQYTADALDVYPAGETPSSVTGADFDFDGDIDLAVTNLNTHSVSILLNSGGIAGNIRFTQPPDGLDFGDVYVADDSTQSFSFFNPTDRAISLDQLSVALPQFTLSDNNAQIAPNETFSFTITFSPSDTLVYIDTLVVQSAAFNPLGEVRIAMRGHGIRAIIDVSPDTLDFGSAQPPQVASLPLQIINNGNGALNISEFRFSDPAFSSQVKTLSIPPYTAQSVNMIFQPVFPVAYSDTLTIFHNDSLTPPIAVYLLGGPNTGPPSITSQDTIDAFEDVTVTYTATSIDPDLTNSFYLFQNLPGWLTEASPAADNKSVRGTPLEGYQDTTFRVIAMDGFFYDTLDVFVRVNPVNDPPVFAPEIADQTTTELIPATFTVTATDIEDSTLVLMAANLPLGAGFVDNGDKSGVFSWIPPADSRGVYPITFIVTERFEAIPLADTMLVNLVVQATLPDLKATSITLQATEVKQYQTHTITAGLRAERASVRNPFRVQFKHDGQVVFDQLIDSLLVNQSRSFAYTTTFAKSGKQVISFSADVFGQTQEVDELNNTITLTVNVLEPDLIVRPNPFTPNQDGFNDEAVFDFSELVVAQPQLKIFSFKGHLLKTIENQQGRAITWDGRNSEGKAMRPGTYLYIFSDRAKRITSGYVVLAR